MRKIENKMIQAIRNQTNWKLNNTEVAVFGDVVNIHLHGHLIAQIHNGQGFIVFDRCGYSTVTTRSRLNAVATLCGEYIGFNIAQREMHYRKGSLDSKPKLMACPVEARI